MRIVITEESHNRVAWTVRTPLPWIALGLAVGWAILALVLSAADAPGRWTILVATAVAVLTAGGVLAVRVPLTERGYLDRGPEGGEVVRAATWLIRGKRVLCSASLDSIAGLGIEEASFYTAPYSTSTLARLKMNQTEGTSVALTGWAEPDQVAALRDALVRAGRLDLVPAHG